MRSVFLLLLLALTAPPVQAQFGSRPRQARPRAEAFMVVPRGGIDFEYQDGVVGLLLRVPTRVIPGVALQAAGDLTFVESGTSRRLALDVVYDFRGLRVGGGPVFRNGFWVDSQAVRDTRSGFSLLLGVGGSVLGRSAITTEIEARFVWVDDLNPRPVTLGLSIVPGRLF
jgi:hypothetical protein